LTEAKPAWWLAAMHTKLVSQSPPPPPPPHPHHTHTHTSPHKNAAAF
jgi:hypothetical protein